MLFLKLGYKNIKRSPVMNILVMLQMSVVFVILISMVSTIVSRFKLYAPFSEEFNRRGYYYFIDSAVNPETNMVLRTTEELCSMIENEGKVFAAYTPIFLYNGEDINAVSYDRDYIEKYTPELESGSWIDVDKTDSDILQVVVTHNKYDFKVGDIIMLEAVYGGQVKAEIVGVLKDNAKIINYSDALKNNSDYRIMYESYNCQRENNALFIFYQNELKDKKVVTRLNGSVLVTYPDDVTEEIIEENDRVIKQMMVIKSVPLSEMKSNSLKYIFLQLYDLMPIFVCVLILTLVGVLSTSALSAKRQLKNYAVYYICGLRWKQCAIVNFWSSFICVGVSFALGLVTTFVIKTTEMFGQTVIEFGIWQFLGCLVITVMYVLLSLILPLNIIGSNTPNQVLKSN